MFIPSFGSNSNEFQLYRALSAAPFIMRMRDLSAALEKLFFQHIILT